MLRLLDHRVVSAQRPRGRALHTLSELISLYEGNFLRLQRLAPELDSMEGTSRSSVAGALDLYLTVLQRFPYTSDLILSYRFPDPVGGVTVAEPDAHLRVYHDVRAVELLAHSRRRRRRWRSGDHSELMRRWRMNRFLYRWLRFCTHQGHLFLRRTAQAPSYAVTGRSAAPRFEASGPAGRPPPPPPGQA